MRGLACLLPGEPREGDGDFGHPDIEIPQPINIFTNLPVGADGSSSWDPALTNAGDSITLRVELDSYVVLTACAQDVLPINNKEPSPLALEVLAD